MELTFDDFIKRIDIQDLLMDAGYVFNRKDGIRYPAYVRPDSNGHHVKGDKFIVYPSRQTCFQPPEIKVYNVISFITEHPHLFKDYQEGMDPYRLVNLVCNRLLNNPIDRTVHPIIKSSPQVKDFNIRDYELLHFQKYNFDNIKQFYPYFVNRGINTNTQKAFGQHFLLATLRKENGTYFKNLSFPLRIPGKTDAKSTDLKDIVGFEERGRARLDGSSGYKGKARGSNSSEGLWIASPNNTELKSAEKVLWFESAYDAMAYYQLNAQHDSSLNKAVFVSTGGNPTVMQFRGVINEASKATHHLCFDNDLAGNQFVENFKNELFYVKSKSTESGPQLFDYIKSLSKPDNNLSGDTDLLPENLRRAYGSYEAAEEEWHSMKQCGSIHPDDLKYQADKALAYYDEYKNKLNTAISTFTEKVSFVREIPEGGSKDWNDLLLKESNKADNTQEESKSEYSYYDIDNDGNLSADECDERKKITNFKR